MEGSRMMIIEDDNEICSMCGYSENFIMSCETCGALICPDCRSSFVYNDGQAWVCDNGDCVDEYNRKWEL